VKEHPILFSGEMVRAILEGRKTQTRRLVRLTDSATVVTIDGVPNRASLYGFKPLRCPYGVPGDRLWVRETWYNDAPGERDYVAPAALSLWHARRSALVEYRATHDCWTWEVGCPCAFARRRATKAVSARDARRAGCASGARAGK
jgi:hypothetical protein